MKFYQQIEMNAPATLSTHVVTKGVLDTALQNLDYQVDVKDVQTDNTLVPTTVEGDRYIVTDVANLNAGFGTITGVGNNDIVQYVGGEFVVVYDVSVRGAGAKAWDTATSKWLSWTGVAWVLENPISEYVDTFVIADWANNAGIYTLTYTSAVHKLGTNLEVKVYEDGGSGDYNEVGVGVNVGATGTVVVTSAVAFDGKVVIK